MPNLPVPDDRIKSAKQLAQFASELQDTEVQQLANIVAAISRRYSTRSATVKNLEALRDEILTRTANVGLLVTVDVAPVLNGEPPVIEVIGHIEGHDKNKYGMDHERKEYEVKKSVERGEDFLGQKESPNSRREKKK